MKINYAINIKVTSSKSPDPEKNKLNKKHKPIIAAQT